MNAFMVVLLTVVRAASAPQPSKRQMRRKSHLYGSPVFVGWIRESQPRNDMARFCRMAACMKRRRIVH